MKTEIQVQVFLAKQTFLSEADWEMIGIFCKKHKYSIPDLKTKFSNKGLSVSQFIDWFNNGFGSGDVVLYNDNLSIVGLCSLNDARICAIILPDGTLEEKLTTASTSDLKRASEDQSRQFYRFISKLGRQYYHSDLKLAQKYIPRINERVEFWSNDGDVHGLGVVRSVNKAENLIELYCYYLYPSDTQQAKLGYSMHETNIITLHDYTFENMAISQQRRLNRELSKAGKIWNEKMHRVEPIKCKAEKGGKYWYISDKVKLVQDIEKQTPTSHFRYLAGNYFLDYDDALDYLTMFHELLRDRLARPEGNPK